MIYRRWGFLVVAVAVSLGGCAQAEPPIAPAAQPSVDSSSAAVTAQGKTAEKTRPAAVAGLFYPAQKQALARQIDEFLAAAKGEPVQHLRGVIVPHAGYRYSGPTAAFAYKQLAGRDFRTVIVMGPSHYAEFQGAFVSGAEAYETPLGRVPLAALARQLAQKPPFAERPRCRVVSPPWAAESPREPPAAGEELPDTWEHSVEVQVPFLQKTLADFTLVPIVFGDVDPQAAARELASRLDDKTLLVASSDLSHYYPDKKARHLDTTCIEAICKLNCEWMAEQEACGKLPILTLMHLARAKGWQAKLLDYRTSGDTAGDRSAVVGYAAIAFFDAQPAKAAPPPKTSDSKTGDSKTSAWTPEDREFLLTLARRSIVQAVQSGKLSEVELGKLAPKLTEPRACFVTLTEKGELRGCIGHIFPREPLAHAVVHNAASAALRDFRFSPVTPQELSKIHIEISILTLPQPLDFKSPEDLLAKLRPRVDGVVLRVGQHQATYLPQVWEQIAGKESFLSHLAEKAGLPPNDWKRPDASVLVYQVEAFEEKKSIEKNVETSGAGR